MTPYAEFLASGVEWLRYQRGCYLVAQERGPWSRYGHKPDLLGVDKTRKCIEIEIKRSLADFKQDADKRVWSSRDLWKVAWPSQFYYFVEPLMVDRVRPLLRDGFGLLTFAQTGKPTFGGNIEIEIVVAARKQKDAKQLSVLQLCEMARHLTGSYSSTVSKLKPTQHPDPDYSI